jgi:hypothetical protein
VDWTHRLSALETTLVMGTTNKAQTNPRELARCRIEIPRAVQSHHKAAHPEISFSDCKECKRRQARLKYKLSKLTKMNK